MRKEEILKIKEYKLILDSEPHHKHEIVDINGVWRWKESPVVVELTRQMNLNDIIAEFHQMGYDKNSEIYRQLYRDMGYSLFGYWETFYWEVNNEDWEEYKAPLIPNK